MAGAREGRARTVFVVQAVGLASACADVPAHEPHHGARRVAGPGTYLDDLVHRPGPGVTGALRRSAHALAPESAPIPTHPPTRGVIR